MASAVIYAMLHGSITRARIFNHLRKPQGIIHSGFSNEKMLLDNDHDEDGMIAIVMLHAGGTSPLRSQKTNNAKSSEIFNSKK